MEKMRALNPEDLEKVIGGASGPTATNDKNYTEFCNAWNALGLNANDPNGSEMNAQYRRWVNSGNTESAYDYLLQFSK